MRTTLNIEDDVLLAAQSIGKRSKKSVGEVVSELARATLTRSSGARVRESKPFYGFRPLPRVPGKTVTNELIDRLREEEGV